MGQTKAARELGIPANTLSSWTTKNKNGEIAKKSAKKPNLIEENERREREIRELKRTNQILREATAFFARSQKR